MQCGNMLFQLFSVSLAIETASSVGRGRDSTGEWSERAMWSSPPSFLSPSRGDAVRGGVNLVVFPSDVLTDRCLLAGENNGVYAELRKKGGGGSGLMTKRGTVFGSPAIDAAAHRGFLCPKPLAALNRPGCRLPRLWRVRVFLARK